MQFSNLTVVAVVFATCIFADSIVDSLPSITGAKRGLSGQPVANIQQAEPREAQREEAVARAVDWIGRESVYRV
jgi:hypothetical protein